MQKAQHKSLAKYLIVLTMHTKTSLYYVYYIKTHDSESRGQEEAGHMQRMSELFTGSTALKLGKALNKPP